MAALLGPKLPVSEVLKKLFTEVQGGASVCKKMRNSRSIPVEPRGLKSACVTSSDPEFEAKTGDRDTALWLITDPHSPWWENKDWCDEMEMMQKVACSSEDLFSEKAKNIIKTLRLVYRQITEVDSSCADLINISSLILSGNFLEHVHCTCLPPELEVLELGFNRIYQMEPLCYQRLSKLAYLGLGHNYLSDVGRYVQYSVLPNLRHLDLSYNNLNNIEEILKVLSYLPHISVLFLNGNPCALVPGYPDYAMSRLPILKQIDGDLISWEGRNAVERFASEGGQFDIKEAVFTVEILRVLNLEPPSQEGEILNNHNNISSPPKKTAKGNTTPKDPNTYYVQIVLFPGEEDNGNILGFSLAPTGGSVQSVVPEGSDESIECTPALPWSECIHFNYGHSRHCHNLLQLRDFLKTPMTVRIIRKTETRVEEDESGVGEQVSVVASFSVPLEIFLDKKGEFHYKWENRPEKDKSDRAVAVTYNLRDFITKSVSKEKDLGKGPRIKPKVVEKETERRRSVGEEDKPQMDKHLTCHLIVTLKRQNCKGHKVIATARPDLDS